ncbi:hypothetical protein JTE90_006218 [Oedothorax gibbosus]|uniref:CST complex subunit CTC1 n=1 Tax=Oedothorax gibbosus TaxID=931172 RepID=A0AAV6VVY4_9ARAC|nr:hypothetical protein JTE90_006218 [Oedothorax gibbosus]
MALDSCVQMNVNGLVIYASENIQLGNEKGLLLTIFNSHMDINFCVLVHGITLGFCWQNINVNHYYQITHLKVGVLESYFGSKKYVLKTTEKSTCKQITSYLLQKFELGPKLKSFVSISAFHPSFEIETNCLSNISYKGFITKIKDADCGVFEIDEKIVLCTNFNPCYSSNHIKIGTEILVLNAHFLKNTKESILLACALSTLRVLSRKLEQDEMLVASHDNFCLAYSLSIYDYLWFERLKVRLIMKFPTLGIEEISTERNSELFYNVIEFFLSIQNEPPIGQQSSLIDEYFSNPHKCRAFTENKFPVDCDLLYLCDIVKTAIDNISWINISKNWKVSINNQDNVILIGLLTSSSNGCFYISDATEKLVIILNKDCDCCPNKHNVIQKCTNTECSILVAISQYDLIFEKITFQNADWHCIKYIRTSCCRIHCLKSTLDIHKRDLRNPLTDKRTKSFDELEEIHDISSDLMNINLLSNSLHQSHKQFLVISKIWNLKKNDLSCSSVLVLFLPEKSSSADSVSETNSFSLPNDSLNYYETDDDFEFADLLKGLNCLSIENNPKLGILCLGTKCKLLYPGHVYVAEIGSADVKEKSSIYPCDIEVFSVLPSSDLEIAHDTNCSGIYNLSKLESLKYISVKDVLLNRVVSSNCILRGVLVDKFYENANNRLSNKNSTVCMKIRDLVSSDSIIAYAPYALESTNGTLPGTIIDLYGFLCVCSKNGNLYIKASSAFGIEILSNQKCINLENVLNERTGIICTDTHLEKDLRNEHYLNSFRYMFYLLKVISAEVFTICSKCQKRFKENCHCLVFSKANIKVSALIDDGKQVYLAASSGNNARMLLGLNPVEWQGLASYVEQHHCTLKFSEKASHAQVNYLPVMDQVFYHYCSSKSICRKLFLDCVFILNTDYLKTDVPSFWCQQVIKCQTSDAMVEFYVRLKSLI